MLETPEINLPSLINKVKSCLIQGRYDEALEYIVQAEISKSLGQIEEKNLILFKIEGFIGISYFKEALELAEGLTKENINLRNYTIIINAYLFQIECCRNLQLFDKALQILERLENLFTKLSTRIKTSNSELYAKYNYFKAHLYQSMGKIPDSIKYYRQALEIIQFLNEKFFLQKILVNLSSAYWEANDLEQSHKLCMQALAIKTTEESYLTISKCLNLLGLIAQDNNNISSALNFYNQSLNLKYKIGNRVEIAKTLHSIGYVNKLLEKYSESLNALQESYNIFEELENFSEMSILQNDIGLLYLRQGDILQAQKKFKTALSLSLKVKNDFLTARNYYSLGKIFILKKDLKNALTFIEKSLELRKKIQNEIDLGETLLQKGIILLLQKEIDSGMKYLNESESCFKNSKNKLMIVKAQLVQIIFLDQQRKVSKINPILASVKEFTINNEITELNLLNDLGNAIDLKNSKRLRYKSKALLNFRKVGQNLKMDVYFNEFALLYELYLLFYEFELFSNERIFEEIKICTTKLMNLADNNIQFSLKIYLLRIKSKLALLFEGIDEGIAFLEEAFLFAQSKNISDVMQELQTEYESLDKKISYWNAFKKKKLITNEDIKKIGLLQLIEEIIDKNLIFYV